MGGLARATKDVDYEQQNYGEGVQREVQWKKEARVGRFNVTLDLNGEAGKFLHNLSPDNWTFEGNYKVECGGSEFQFEYTSNWGLDEVVVRTNANFDPLVQMNVA